MDNQGYLAKMHNNNSGWLPKVLLSIPDIKLYLDDLSEYIDGESEKYNNKINNILLIYIQVILIENMINQK